MIVGFAGMGHLGQVMAQATEAKGFEVVRCGFGCLPDVVTSEPGLRDNVIYNDSGSLIGTCDVVYISKDTPTNENGWSNLLPVLELIDLVVPEMKADAVLVILSQVPPGFTRDIQYHGPLYYQVDTLIRGKAIERATHPERIIVGCSDRNAQLDQRYWVVLSTFGCPIFKMSYESAELTKIAVNCYLAAQIATSNLLSTIADEVGADWMDIIPALCSDARIGKSAYVLPGVFGNHIKRDLVTIAHLCDQFGIDTQILEGLL